MVDCQYLKNNVCLSIQENIEVKEARKIACENENEKACCYLCEHYPACEINCTFLGKINLKSTSQSDSKKVNIKRCPDCKTKMRYAIINLRVGGWEGIFNVLPIGGLGTVQEELLPVKMYVCSKCGNIKFVALEKTKLKLINVN